MTHAIADDGPFTGNLVGFANSLHWVEEKRGDSEPAAASCSHIRCFQPSVGGPWQAACSLWAKYYFNRLLIPATCLLAWDWRDNLFAHRVSASFCPETGTPLHFTIHAERRCGPNAELAFVTLLDAHIRRLIDELAEVGGLSKRMLWEGVDHTLRWSATEVSVDRPDRIQRLQRVAQCAGSALRLSSPWTANLKQGPSADVARKFCCLRYQIAGFQACPGLCPRSTNSIARAGDNQSRGRL
jgi:siderophore-iron reductase FhuF